jgi:transcriptional regulator with XRE-family HTH domain
MHKLNVPTDNPQKLTQAVLQASQLLGMYQAELASILGITCSQIGELANAKRFLKPDTVAWQRAALFIRLYNLLYDRYGGDEVATYHWLRVENKVLKGTPLYLMVDHGLLHTVLAHIEHAEPPTKV